MPEFYTKGFILKFYALLAQFISNYIIPKTIQMSSKNQYRLRDINWKEQNKPMFSASNIHYDIADGGIGGISG